MSHPAASIKSIISGKMNLDNPDLYDYASLDSNSNVNSSSNVNVNSNNSSNSLEGFEYEKGPRFDDDLSSRFSHDSGNSVNSTNLKTLSSELNDNTPMEAKKHTKHSKIGPNITVANQEGNQDAIHQFYNQPSSTSASIISSSSEYQQGFPPASAARNDMASLKATPQPESELSDTSKLGTASPNASRPLSRNSTTSCLSTTATKDGIEGKKLHRSGPTPYSSNIIASMLQNQIQTQNQIQQQQIQRNAAGTSPVFGHNSTRSVHKPLNDVEEANIPDPAIDVSMVSSPPPQIHDDVSSSTEHDPDGDFSMNPQTAASPPRLTQLGNSSNNFSQASVTTTGAQVDGDVGSKEEVEFERISKSFPPVSLSEKIELLDRTRP